MTEIIQSNWPQICAAVAAIVYVLRVEGRLNHVEKVQETEGARIAKAIEAMSETQTKMADSLSDMRATLSGIVGYERGKEESAKRARK